MAQFPPSVLSALEKIKEQFDEHSENNKVRMLDELADARFRNAAQLMRFHELLCFIRTYPDGPAIYTRAERLLDNFDLRSDLRKYSEKLVNSGIAGTRIDYAFYYVTADWLAGKWPDSLRICWDEPFENRTRLPVLLRSLLPYSELIILDESAFSPRKWIEKVKGPSETDGAFLVNRIRKLRCRDATREMIFEDLDIPMSVIAGPGTPSRTKARFAGSPVVWQKKPRSRKRPVLRKEIRKPPEKISQMSRKDGSRLIDLARQSMVTRSREVDAFAHANRDDVVLADCGQGLQFAGMGGLPKHRHILESVYIFLILKNGTPIGYIQAAALFGSVEVNFNLFETFRGADAGWVYGRALATIHKLMKSDCFVLDPYQVGGDGNTEGLKSGAWWFYYKMGFRPRDAETRRLGLEEARKARSKPGYRTSMSVLRELAQFEMYLYLGRQRDDVLSIFPLENLGLHVTRMMARRFASDREKGVTTCVGEATKLLGVGTIKNLAKDERQAWARWSPLVLLLPGLERWNRREKTALASIICAKGATHELDYLHQFDRHKRLRAALVELSDTPID